MSTPRLISFDVCPYVQRAAIMLQHGNIAYDVEYIDLGNPPSWFKEISPLGKVPLLEVDGTILFESAVICDYLEEVNNFVLYPSDPLQKALYRGLVEFGSDMLVKNFMLGASADEAQYKERLALLTEQLETLESRIVGAPYFMGETFSMLDVAFAPLLLRLNLLDTRFQQNILQDFPKVVALKDTLIALESVQKSAVPDLSDRIVTRICDNNGYFSTLAS